MKMGIMDISCGDGESNGPRKMAGSLKAGNILMGRTIILFSRKILQLIRSLYCTVVASEKPKVKFMETAWGSI
jgi:hypothetical protein